MKVTGILVPVYILMAAGLGLCLMLEGRVCLNLEAQNAALRREVGQLAELKAENQRLSNLLAQTKTARLHPDGTTAANGQMGELTHLRSEVEMLHQQGKELETLHADTQATHNALKEVHDELRANRMAAHHDSSNTNGEAFEVLEAYYGTDRTNMEVSAALNDRIRGGNLKTVAGNGLMGDPDYGKTKDLTIVYRYGGVVMTNQFREGDLIILPPEEP